MRGKDCDVKTGTVGEMVLNGDQYKRECKPIVDG